MFEWLIQFVPFDFSTYKITCTKQIYSGYVKKVVWVTSMQKMSYLMYFAYYIKVWDAVNVS